MRYQPTQARKGNDDVQTPPELAEQVAFHFLWPIMAQRIDILEPCQGDGNFVNAIRRRLCACWRLAAFDIKDGVDFLEGHPDSFLRDTLYAWDWIITNPPWSKIRPFLDRSMAIADNVVFLMTVNHAFTKARIRGVAAAGFGLKEILLLDTPKKETGWPQMGFQLGAVHWQRGYVGPVTIGSGQ